MAANATVPVITDEERAADSGSNVVLEISYAMIAVNTIFIILFYISRYINKTAVAMPMFILMPLAYIFNIGNCVIGLLFVYLGGTGKLAKTLPMETLVANGKISKAAEYIYVLAVMFPKLAILALYLQVFTSRMYIRLIYGTGAIVILNCLASILVSCFICKPFSAYWDKVTPGGHCGNIMEGYRWVSIPSLITDVVILLIPIPVLFQVQVSTVTKAGLIVTFLTASMGIVTCVLRMHAFFSVEMMTDPTWLAIRPWIFTVLEPSGYFIAAILPTTRHLQRRIFRSTGLATTVSSFFNTTSKGNSQRPTPSDIELSGHVKSGANQGNMSADRKGFARIDEEEADNSSEKELVK